jgi:hypothetical protein
MKPALQTQPLAVAVALAGQINTQTLLFRVKPTAQVQICLVASQIWLVLQVMQLPLNQNNPVGQSHFKVT